MFEDILRAAKKANGENLNKPPSYPMVKTPKYDAPAKWYEKKWGVALMLIICFPLGGDSVMAKSSLQQCGEGRYYGRYGVFNIFRTKQLPLARKTFECSAKHKLYNSKHRNYRNYREKDLC